MQELSASWVLFTAAIDGTLSNKPQMPLSDLCGNGLVAPSVCGILYNVASACLTLTCRVLPVREKILGLGPLRLLLEQNSVIYFGYLKRMTISASTGEGGGEKVEIVVSAHHSSFLLPFVANWPVPLVKEQEDQSSPMRVGPTGHPEKPHQPQARMESEAPGTPVCSPVCW